MVLLKHLLDALNFDDLRFDASRIEVKHNYEDSCDVFAVTELAASSIAAAGLALTQYAFGRDYQDKIHKDIIVDQHLAYLWFGSSIRPQGWALASPWDDLAGDYQTRDGWIRLHTNAPHHRNVVTDILGHLDRASMVKEVVKYSGNELEEIIVEQGGAAAKMMDRQAWAQHPQGIALSTEPLIGWQSHGNGKLNHQPHLPRPLEGLNVLDLTRIIAGPVATRFLAHYGANVLRIDPKAWDEGEHILDMTPGKSCAALDLKDADDFEHLKRLISQADVFIHGYRADALEKLGLDAENLREINPSLIDIAHNAYGWSGPWRNRRGFDSLVQMSSGIAATGMRISQCEKLVKKPWPMTVQALDHATGYLIAASALCGLSHLRDTGEACSARLSLARTAELLKTTERGDFGANPLPEKAADISGIIENTALGPVQRLIPPLYISAIKPSWTKPASLLHRSCPRF